MIKSWGDWVILVSAHGPNPSFFLLYLETFIQLGGQLGQGLGLGLGPKLDNTYFKQLTTPHSHR